MKFRITVDVEYTQSSRTHGEIVLALERELNRHIDDGLLLYDESVEQFSAEVTAIDAPSAAEVK